MDMLCALYMHYSTNKQVGNIYTHTHTLVATNTFILVATCSRQIASRSLVAICSYPVATESYML
jgi:hypothetical protein